MLAHTDDPHWARLQALQLELDKAIDQTALAQSWQASEGPAVERSTDND